jgi:methane/ammonia monooxygenase subunit C
MSSTTYAVGAVAARETAGIRGVVPWRFMLITIVAVAVAFTAIRVYQQLYAWDYGMDAFEPEFQTYWMNLFYGEIVVEFIVAGAVWGSIWVTRDRHLDRLTPNMELRRWFQFVAWLAIYVWIVYFAGSFFAEQDASWHQVVIRDTSFTPSHIILFYLTFPAYIIAGVGGWLWARTRLPLYSKGIPIAYTLAVVGPFLIMPNIGYNEFGHAFWFMEELFSAPLHYGFVVFGWSALGLGGVLIQVSQRMLQLLKVEARARA